MGQDTILETGNRTCDMSNREDNRRCWREGGGWRTTLSSTQLLMMSFAPFVQRMSCDCHCPFVDLTRPMSFQHSMSRTLPGLPNSLTPICAAMGGPVPAAAKVLMTFHAPYWAATVSCHVLPSWHSPKKT